MRNLFLSLYLLCCGCAGISSAMELEEPINALCVAKGAQIVEEYEYREDAEIAYARLELWCNAAVAAFEAIDEVDP